MAAGSMSTVLSYRMSRRELLAGATGLALAHVVGPAAAAGEYMAPV